MAATAKSVECEYTCENEECQRDIWLGVTFGVPAQVWGPPERCHPEEGPEVSMDRCPHCETPINIERAVELAEDWAWE